MPLINHSDKGESSHEHAHIGKHPANIIRHAAERIAPNTAITSHDLPPGDTEHSVKLNSAIPAASLANPKAVNAGARLSGQPVEQQPPVPKKVEQQQAKGSAAPVTSPEGKFQETQQLPDPRDAAAQKSAVANGKVSVPDQKQQPPVQVKPSGQITGRSRGNSQRQTQPSSQKQPKRLGQTPTSEISQGSTSSSQSQTHKKTDSTTFQPQSHNAPSLANSKVSIQLFIQICMTLVFFILKLLKPLSNTFSLYCYYDFFFFFFLSI